MLHSLKINPQYFDAVTNGNKNYEVRKNDRNYEIGDYIALNEYSFDRYTGRFTLAKITSILEDEGYCKEGFVILGISPCQMRLFTNNDYEVYGGT